MIFKLVCAENIWIGSIRLAWSTVKSLITLIQWDFPIILVHVPLITTGATPLNNALEAVQESVM